MTKPEVPGFTIPHGCAPVLGINGQPVIGGDWLTVKNSDGIEWVVRRTPKPEPQEKRMLAFGVPKRYVYPDVTQDNLIGVDDHMAKLRSWDHERWVLIHADVGRGKSTILAELARTTKERYLWINWHDFCESIKDSWDTRNEGRTQKQFVDGAKKADVLFIDDLGKSSKSSYVRDRKGEVTRVEQTWHTEVAYSILSYRYDNRMPVAITCEYNPNRLKEYIGFAAISRIMQTAISIDLSKQPEFRLQQRKERF